MKCPAKHCRDGNTARSTWNYFRCDTCQGSGQVPDPVDQVHQVDAAPVHQAEHAESTPAPEPIVEQAPAPAPVYKPLKGPEKPIDAPLYVLAAFFNQVLAVPCQDTDQVQAVENLLKWRNQDPWEHAIKVTNIRMATKPPKPGVDVLWHPKLVAIAQAVDWVAEEKGKRKGKDGERITTYRLVPKVRDQANTQAA